MQGGSNQSQSYSTGGNNYSGVQSGQSQSMQPMQGYSSYNLPSQNPYQNIWNGLSFQNAFSNMANQQLQPSQNSPQVTSNIANQQPAGFTQADNNAAAGIPPSTPATPVNPASTGQTIGGINLPSNTPAAPSPNTGTPMLWSDWKDQYAQTGGQPGSAQGQEAWRNYLSGFGKVAGAGNAYQTIL